MLSASADGLVRLWTIRTGECEVTLDQHSDRIWALEYYQTNNTTTTHMIEGNKIFINKHNDIFTDSIIIWSILWYIFTDSIYILL